MHHRRIAACAAALAITVATGGSPAFADRRTGVDRVGDSTAGNDITRVTVNNGPHAITAVVEFRNLDRLISRTTTLFIDPGARGGRITFLAKRFFDESSGGWHVNFIISRPRSGRGLLCPGLRIEAFPGARSEMIFRVPQRCLHERAGNAWFQATADDHRPRLDRAPAEPMFIRRG